MTASAAPSLELAVARDPILDIVRAVAILLVLVQHAGGPDWTRFGWTGVDLFFVLSGFLVTRLLLKEHQERGTADSVRFLIRRAFKIYPAFWVMLFVSLWALRASGQPPRPLAVLCELLFVQNYGPGVWVHTWSLAVEEHFYLFLAALFWHPAVPAWLAAKPRRLAVAVLAACLAVAVARVALALSLRPDLKLLRFGTHARFDALLCGAALAACFQHGRAALEGFLAEHRTALLSAAAAMLAAGVLVHEKSPFWYVGLSLLPWAFAVLVAFALAAGLPGSVRGRAPVRLLAGIGRYSYGIYLWHIPLYQLLLADFVGHFGLSPAVTTAIYFASTLGLGALLSEVVESPFLALRDRLFPSRRPPQAEALYPVSAACPSRPRS